MRKIIETFVKHKFYANLIVIFLLIAGSLSFMNMKKSFFPERKTRSISVRLSYPGASPKEMEESMTTRVEQAIRGLVGIKETSSKSSENFAVVNITTTGEYDIDETLRDVKNAVDSISSFPADMERPVVSKNRTTTQALYMGLSGDVSLKTLKDYAQEIEDDLYASGLMSQISINGYPSLEISVEIDEEELLRYKLTPSDIANAIAKNNRDISGGMLRSTKEEILIRSRARSVDPEKIGEITVRSTKDGSRILIRDVATVKTQFQDTTSGTWMRGHQSISIQVNKLATEDLKKISDFCKKYVADFNNEHKDQGVKLDVTFDFMGMLNSRLELLYSNGGIGLALVLITLGLFLNTRLSAWVAWGIPSAFLAMYILAVMYGVTINMISLFGMILVIGILVDDGIVIAENIYTHFEKGASPKKAAVEGTMEVLPAVLTSVTTTIVAFSPLLLLEGVFEFFFEMGFVVIFSLFFSLFEAFLVLPAHIGTEHILRSKKRASGAAQIREKLESVINKIKINYYGKLLKKIIAWKWLAAIVPIAFIIITIGLVQGEFLRVTFFPTIPFDNFNIDIAFDAGSGEAQTRKYLDKFEKAVWTVNDRFKKKYNDPDDLVKFTFLNMGRAFNGQDSGSHAGSIMVLLRDLEGAAVSSFQITQAIRKEIGHVAGAEKFSISGFNRWGKPVSFSLIGRNMDELKKAKKYVIEQLEKYPDLSNITSNDAPGMQEIRIKLKPKAYFLGLDRAVISNQVRNAFYGAQAQRLQSGRDELRVWVRYPKKSRLNMGQLEQMKIKTPSGDYPLTELIDYTVERGPVSINHYNGQREIRIESDMKDPNAPVPPVLAKIHATTLAKMMEKYPTVRVTSQGQQKESNEAAVEMQKLFTIAFGVIIIILMIHFKSFSQPALILSMIPLAWLGAAWGHGVEGMPISMLSAWGMVALSGVVINDAVVFLSKFNSNLENGMTVNDAIYDAGLARFRAILLTTITTVAGLYPIVLEQSFQAQFLKPMAIALAYGVLFGTMFILTFLPAFTLVLNDMRLWVHNIIRKNKAENPREVEPAVINSRVTID